MFNVNWYKLIIRNTPPQLLYVIRLEFMYTLISSVKSVHDLFLATVNDLLLKTSYSGQVIYLTKALNDRFDAILQRIWIDDTVDVSKAYFYNKIEGRIPVYLYNKYKGTTQYYIGDFAWFQGSVYECMHDIIGTSPVSAYYWKKTNKALFIKNKAEYVTQFDFIVMVPTVLVYDQNEMKALVNLYKLAGKRYTIQTY